MLKTNVETFLACDTPYEEARIVLFGAPFDSTTSFRPGARLVLRLSCTKALGWKPTAPTRTDLEDCKVFDSGDLELCFSSSKRR